MNLDYGIIGNCKTSALISKRGSLDWCCFPKFDSPSAFAKLLDNKKGGSFEIIPLKKCNVKQEYLKNTNILKTVLYNQQSKFEIIDFFIKYRDEKGIAIKDGRIYRLIKVLKGSPKVKVLFNPQLNYARGKTKLRISHNALVASHGKEKIFLQSSTNLQEVFEGKPIELKNNDYFIVSYEKECTLHSLDAVLKLLEKTTDYWKDFVNKSTWPKFYRKEVIRSGLALKLLTYDKTGAIVAAPTTSIPEIIGEKRNWDYRFCWLRDSAYTISALTRICHFDEAIRYMKYLKKVALTCDLKEKEKIYNLDLQVMYGIDGNKNLSEKILKHLAGFQNSKPVRIGNAAYKQEQIDIAGELIYTIHEFYVHYRYAKQLDDVIWHLIKHLITYVMTNWKKKDHGIWEFRKTRKHFTFSKVLCWVALEKAIEIAEFFKKKDAPLDKWKEIRNEIRDEVMIKAYNTKKKAFTMAYDDDALDASVLLMTYFDFIKPNYEKMKNTIKAIEKGLAKDCLVFRYKKKDEMGVPKNAFLVCSFWLIDSLYLSGQKRKAKSLFRKVMKYSNHLGLYSEAIDVKTGDLTGNFPQAYTHIALINSAVLLSGRGTKRPVCKIHI